VKHFGFGAVKNYRDLDKIFEIARKGELPSMKWPFWTRIGLGQPDDCETIDPLLSLHADGMASRDESGRVEAHLLGCADCRESLQWMRATQRALSARPVVEPPVDLHARITAAISASSAAPLPTSFQTRPASTFTRRPALAAAASLSILGLVGYSLLHHSAPQTTVRPARLPMVATGAVSNTPTPTVLPSPSAKTQTKHFAPVTIHPAPTENTQLADRNTDNTVEEDTSTPPESTKSTPLSLPVHAHSVTVLVKKAARPTLAPSLMATKTPIVPSVVRKTPVIQPEKEKAEPVVALVPKPETTVPVTIAPTIVHQDPPARVAYSAGEGHSHTEDLMGSVKAHLGQMQNFTHATIRRVNTDGSLAVRLVDQEKTPGVDAVHGSF
jgi:hypothetical protein